MEGRHRDMSFYFVKKIEEELIMAHIKEIIGEEAFNALPEDKKKELEKKDFVDSSGYVEKRELDTAYQTIKDYKKEIGTRDTQLNDLQGKVKDNETLTKEINDLKEANEKTTKDYEAKLNQISFDTKFEKAIAQYKTKNPKALKALLDMEKIKLVEGGSFIGLDEQIKALKESDAYLFEQELPGGTGVLGGGSSSITDDGKEQLSLGARLAKEKAESAKVTEAQNKFFA